MERKLTELQRMILVGLVADARAIKRKRLPNWGPYNLPKEYRDFLKSRKAGAAPVDPATWTGMEITTDAQRMAVSRSYVALEKAGLIERLFMSWAQTRCTHLAPTPAGVKLAAELKAAADGK